MEALDFGRYLTQQRELRGMSREQVAQATRIPVTMVAALEDGRFAKLPGRVFVVNFIRSYAQVIGLEADDTLLRFQEAAGLPEAVEELPQKLPKGKVPSRNLRNAWFLFVAILLLVTCVWVAHHFSAHGHP